MYSTLNPFVDEVTVADIERQLSHSVLNDSRELVIDSRRANAATIFCAYPGATLDGRNFISQAVQNGCNCILWEEGIDFTYPVENYAVKNLQHYTGLIAAAKAKFPSQAFYSIAVTGTNGKTSISHWLNQAYSFLGYKSAIIGTTGAGVYPNVTDYASTTPDPITLQHLLSDFKQQQIQCLAMEVSSHALSQGRVNGVDFKCAIFTNLTQDHLDYHKTMADYFAAKKQLFYWTSLEHAVINADDIYGTELLSDLRKNNPRLNLISYGVESGDLRADNLHLSSSGISFDLLYQGMKQEIKVAVVGRFNVYNLLAVFATLLVKQVAWEKLAEIALQLKPVTGRMDALIIANKPLVVVDYAHTPDALEKALSTLQEIKHTGKLFCVFGCGGNRDRGKRPQMGRIAAELADEVIITTDNPRDEEPLQIIQDITVNLTGANYQVVVDRAEAIRAALAAAKAGDIVLVAGKGHETYQEIHGVKHHFSDFELVNEILQVN